MTRACIFRLTAVLILLFTGAELFACEVFAPDQCESFGFPQEGGSPPGDGSCLCCCAHIIVAQPVLLDTSVLVVTTLDPVDPLQVDQQPASIYHPPKS
jgi:hypothetical protein